MLSERTAGEYPVANYGAAADCSTDDSSAIQAAINAASSVGGGTVLFAPGCYAIGSPLVVNASHVILEAAGTSIWTGGNLPSIVGARLKWIGSPGTTMLTVTPISDPSQQQIIGVNVVGLSFLCESVASVALDVYSQWNGIYNFYAEKCNTSLMRLLTVPQLATNVDVQELDISLYGDQSINSGYGLYMHGNVSALPQAGNPSINHIRVVDVKVGSGGTGVYLGDCDHNQFDTIRAVGSPSSNTIVFAASAVSGSANARRNIVRYLVGSGAVSAQGTETAAFASQYNHIEYLDVGNGTPLPTIGTGAILWWHTDTGVYNGQLSLAVGDTFSSMQSAYTQKTSQTIYVTNSASNHIVMAGPDGVSNRWLINVDGSTGNGRIFNNVNTSKVFEVRNPLYAPQMLIAPSGQSATQQLLMGNTTVRIYSALANHILLTDGTNTYGISIDGSGNLRTTTDSGTNIFRINQGVQFLNYAQVARYICAGCSAPPTENIDGDISGLRIFDSNIRVARSITCTGCTTQSFTDGVYTFTVPSSSGVTSVSGTAGEIDSSGGTTPVISIPATWTVSKTTVNLGASSSFTIGKTATYRIYDTTNDLLDTVPTGQQYVLRFGTSPTFTNVLVCTSTGCIVTGNLQVVGTALPAALKTPQAIVVGSISYGTTATVLALQTGACTTGGSPAAVIDGTAEVFDLTVTTGAGGCTSGPIITVELTNLITAWSVPKGNCIVTSGNNQAYDAGFSGLYTSINFAGAEYVLTIGVLGTTLSTGVDYSFHVQCRGYDMSITADDTPLPTMSSKIQEKVLLKRMSNIEKKIALLDKIYGLQPLY